MLPSLDIRTRSCVAVALLASACASALAPAGAQGEGLTVLSPSADRALAQAAVSRDRGSSRDLDGDGVPNYRDRNVDGDGAINARDRDIDGDGTPNGHDRNLDGDGAVNARDRDIDGDGAANGRDSDMDCDRVPNRFDPDMDGDGVPNYRDPDSDTDRLSENGRLPRRVRLPKAFFGMSAPHVYASNGAARAAQLSQIARTGIGTLRQTFEWSRIETSPGVYDLRAYDSFVGDAAGRGLSVLPVLFDPPGFRSARPATGAQRGSYPPPATGAQRGTYPPRSAGEFATFAITLVRRYGPGGSFWAEHPSIPRRPIRAWQVWNEPHLRAYWPSGPDPAAYTAMLRVVAGGIRYADPRAEVITAAISQSNIGMPLATFVRGMYRAGAKGAFDSLAIHPYAPAADQVYKIMRGVRRIANRYGDRRATLRVTELGWATGGPRSPFRPGYRGQGELIKRTWATLVRRRAKLKLRGLIYFGWRDLPPYAPLYQDFYGLHTGLLERDGRSKPSRARFTRAVRAMSAR